MTATCRGLYVFVALEVGSRRLVHLSVTDHPSAAWSLPQCREGLAAPLTGHRRPRDARVVAQASLGGLHHESGFEKRAA